MTLLAELPVEVLLDSLFPSIPVPDLLRLGSTNKYFASLCNDDTFWKRKLQADFNFSGAGTARTSGWKFIYRGLSKPQVFVWGDNSHGRLGLTNLPSSSLHGVPFPTRLRIPNVCIVNLIAGGMSFHALDSKGNIHVWGTLDGTTAALNSDGYSESGKPSHTPLRLQMPAPTRSISCGRIHSASLDSNHQIWNFLSWGRPFRLSSASFADPDSTPIQIECGWGFTSVLTKSGEVFIWWPFGREMRRLIEEKDGEMDQEGDKKAEASEGVIPCVTWELQADPIRLPALPSLPDLPNTGTPPDESETHLIQIAALDRHIIGLTNRGHVLKICPLEDQTASSRGNWQYLSKFSELNEVKTHPTFSNSGGGGSVEPPQTMQITHISAHFMKFIAYSTGSSSIVLMGDIDTTDESEPKIIPDLQNRSVISIVLGDYHNGALTATGKLLTWGAYSSGALGLGDPVDLPVGAPGGFATRNAHLRAQSQGRGEPPAVEVPTEVRFDHGRKHPKDRFCFSASAAGWHTGALVIDLEPDARGEEEEDISTGQGSSGSAGPRSPQHPYLPHGPGGYQSPPIVPLPGIFRFGHAARGMFRGRGASTTQGQSSEPVGEQANTRRRGTGIFGRVGFAGRGNNGGTAPDT